MPDDCWGPGEAYNREPEEWATDKGYDEFHSRYKNCSFRFGDGWECKKCGALTVDTSVHDEWHREISDGV